MNERVFLDLFLWSPFLSRGDSLLLSGVHPCPRPPLPFERRDEDLYLPFEKITAKLLELASILSFDHRFVVKRILFETDLDLLTAQLNQPSEDQQGSERRLSGPDKIDQPSPDLFLSRLLALIRELLLF